MCDGTGMAHRFIRIDGEEYCTECRNDNLMLCMGLNHAETRSFGAAVAACTGYAYVLSPEEALWYDRLCGSCFGHASDGRGTCGTCGARLTADTAVGGGAEALCRPCFDEQTGVPCNDADADLVDRDASGVCIFFLFFLHSYH